jgi:transglutaminase-like putative cysteine protease
MLACLIAAALCTPPQGPSRPFFALPTADAAAPAEFAMPVADATPLAVRAERAAERVAKLDRARFDLGARAATIADTAAAVAMLQQEIGFDSYSGVLRGAQGCYAQRAGNALDRALLLAELLRRQKVKVRFARGQLADDRAGQLVDKLFQPAVLPMTTPPADPTGLPARIRTRATANFAAVHAALPAPPCETASRGELLGEVREHFWLQIEQGGKWLDLDPTFADLKPGQAPASVEQTYDALPAALRQTITVRVVTETFVDGAVQTATPLALELPAQDWLEEHVFLLHQPSQGLGHAVAGTDAPWVPMLVVGNDVHAGKGIAFGLKTRSDVIAALSADDQSAPAASPVVAEWLEIELRTPDGRSELHRRALLDRAGAVRRSQGAFTLAQLAPLPTDGRGPLCCQEVHNLVFSAGAHDVADYAEAVARLSAAMAAHEKGEQALPGEGGEAGLEALWPFALQTLGWQYATDHLIVPALGDAAGVRLYADLPRVWIASIVRTGPAETDTAFVLDLRRDRLRGLAAAPARTPELAARKLWFALLEGALEHEVLAEMAGNGGCDPRTVTSASSALGKAGCIALAGDGGNKDAASRLPNPLAAAHARACLQRGSVVVAPAGATATDDVAFWEIETNGDARAVYGLDWNGASLAASPSRLGGFPPRNSYSGGSQTPPSHYNPGNKTGGTSRGGWNGPKSGGKPAGGGRQGPRSGRAGGSEYVTLLLTISIPSAYGWFVVGLAVQVTAGTCAALLMDAGMM